METQGVKEGRQSLHQDQDDDGGTGPERKHGHQDNGPLKVGDL